MESRLPNPRAPQPAPPNIPIILVTDFTSSPLITTHYHLGTNVLDFQPIYTLTKSLLTHAPCPHSALWPCPSCTRTFLSKYWTVAAHLLDYFADFAHADSALMLSLWFHLLDTWQETASYFPCAEVLGTQDVAPDAVQRFTAARWFLEEVRGTMGLVDMLIYGWMGTDKQRMGRETEQVVHVPSGDVRSLAGEYNTGPYLSGLRTWNQWLATASPGVALDALHTPHALRAPTDKENGIHEEGITRHVPQAGLALIRTHTIRARNIAARMNTDDKEYLLDLDANALSFPTKPSAAQQHTYTSAITGRTVTYQLVNGAPPVVRYPGYGDPSMLCSRQDFGLLDECVGMCRGVEAYVPVSGEGGEDDSEEEEGEYVEEAFDVWSVYETKEGKVGEGWREMFDTWEEGEKV
jgi:hypothetical protein